MGRGPAPGLSLRPSRSWRAGCALVLVVLLGLLPACAAPAPSPTAPAPAADPQALLDTLVRAARAQDRTAFDAEVSTADPSFADRARLLYTNLAALPWADLELRLQPERAPLPDRLRDRLGAGAWRQAATARWRLTGETTAAEHTVWLTFALADGRPRLAGTDAPGAGDGVARTPQPVWWTGPVSAASRAGVTVVVGAGQPAARWLDRAGRAAAVVRERVRAGAAASWDGVLVVEVPGSRAAFEAVLGAEPGSYAGIAAVTTPEGPGDAPLRVLVNPEVSRTLAPLGVAVVLSHEAVHVATRSPGSPAPTWVVEGLADQVALAAHPSAAAGVAEPLLARVRAGRAPRDLPADDAFRAGADDLAVSYAEAWTVCRWIAERYPPGALAQLYTALDEGQDLAAATRSALGASPAQLVAGWRAELRRQAGG